MTTKADFTAEEWKLILEGPPSAGFLVITAQRGGMFRETISMAKAYAEAREQHGSSALLDEIVSNNPKTDHTRHHSYDELRDHTIEQLRSIVTLLEGKATPDEVAGYKKFVVTVATKAAEAKTEKGNDEPISEAEQAALTAISDALA